MNAVQDRVGLGWRPELAAGILANLDRIDVIEVIGKTILPVRQNKRLLEGDDAVERLLRLERELANDPASAALAGHLQITARKTR